jgi:hypothetical protein
MVKRSTLRGAERRLLTRSIVAALSCLLAACSASTSSDSGSSAGSSGVSPSPASITPDPLQGTWHTAHLTASDLARAVHAAGGTKAEGASFSSEFGARRFVVISMHFQSDGSFFETESADGGPAHEGYLATYRVSGSSMTLTSANPGDSCVATYAFTITDGKLRLHALRQCKGLDGIFNTTLFASFPYTGG